MNKKKFSFKKDVEELKEIVQQLNKSFFSIKETVDQLRIDFDLAQEQNPFNVNVWLKPSELAAILKISNSTVTKWRNEGLFKKTSVKKMARGKRTDFYYHRINAIKDVSLIKPIQILTNKKTLNHYGG
jgi:DNA-binding transcriptional regulator YiaG|tara:strand:+ start:128 stop:511 length:384 start_codon:yes stop_codon:yes gene_type:complete